MTKTIYVVLPPEWEYNDEYYYLSEGHGTPSKGFTTREAAEQWAAANPWGNPNADELDPDERIEDAAWIEQNDIDLTPYTGDVVAIEIVS